MSSSNNNNTWKHPSAQHCQKYNLVDEDALPDGFLPTREESMLLELYTSIQSLERQAAKLKEEAARAKLNAAEAEFVMKRTATATNKPNSNKRVRSSARDAITTTTTNTNRDTEQGEETMDTEDDDNRSETSAERQESLQARREAKLATLRSEIEAAKQQQKQSQEDALREQLLQEQEPIMDGPVLKRKRMEERPAATTSLIANLTSAVTPPHEFSKKLNLSVTQGRNLFPPTSITTTVAAAEGAAGTTAPSPPPPPPPPPPLLLSSWTPPHDAVSPNEKALELSLDDFDMSKAQVGQGNNTIVIQFTAPSESKRFSLNLATADQASSSSSRKNNTNNFESVLFHFNPRQFERGGQILLNDKQDCIWGQALALPTSQVPLIFGQPSSTVMIQITGEGFDVFVRDTSNTTTTSSGDGLVHVARWEHRKELNRQDKTLILQLPSTDDYGSREDWIVYKVWWGHLPVRAKENAQVPGVDNFNSMHPRKLFVSGLPKLHLEADVDVRRAELERAFRKYGGDRGVSVIAPLNATYAFVEMENERQADMALSEMSSQYRLNRARRTKHEALQEERAAKEAGKQLLNKDGTEWD